MLRLLSLLSVVALFLIAAVPSQANDDMPAIPGAPPAQPQTQPKIGDPPPIPPELLQPQQNTQPPPVQEVAEWYYVSNGSPIGPVTLSQLQALIAQGQVGGDTAVWKSGMAGWARLADVPELAPLAVAGTRSDGVKPPPVVDSQKLLDDKVKAFIVGTWRFEGYVTQGSFTAYVILEIAYRPDGSYAGMQSLQFAPMGGIQTPPQTSPRQGRYTVTASDETHFVLITTEYNSERGQTNLVIIDSNTVEDPLTGNRSYRIR